ncbi:MAG: hypothetical protein K5673_05185 [Lachnospiraceae bacterium]|nr:hypothetical protein [Lachnospiraceae bacterium]
MKKKIVLLLISACLLCACGNNEVASETTETPSQTSDTQVESKTETEDAVVEAEDKAAEIVGEESSVPELPEGHYLLDTENNPFYQVDNGIAAGIYHVEDYSDDFGCVIFSSQIERYNGLTANDEENIEKLDKLSGFCAGKPNKSVYNYEVFAYNPDIPFSGASITDEPQSISDETPVYLMNPNQYIVCTSGSATLVLDQEYDAATYKTKARIPDFGTWADNTYKNDSFGINLTVPTGKKFGWRAPSDKGGRYGERSEYSKSVADVPSYSTVIDEVATQLFSIGAIDCAKLNVTVYDTEVPMGEVVGTDFYGLTPDRYAEKLMEQHNRKIEEDPDHYASGSDISDDTVWGIPSKTFTILSTKDGYSSGPDGDKTVTYTTYWIGEKDGYLVVTKLDFWYPEMDANKENAAEFNDKSFHDVLDIVGDILGNL